MPLFACSIRLLVAAVALLAVGACSPSRHAVERAQVKTDFNAFRQALLSGHAEQVVVYLPQDVSDYLLMINTGEPPRTDAAAASSNSPSVKLLLRTVLDKKVPPTLRDHMNLQLLLQRLGDRGLLDCREIRDVSLGQVGVNGDHADGELYFRGNLLPLRVPFIRQSGVWKVDLLSMLPYAEVLMRLDRAVTGKSESQQVAQIVAPLPLL